MPIYEYSCDHCQLEFELLVSGHDQAACPNCHGEKLQKRLSVPAVHAANRQLSQCESTPPSQGCGLPQCGMGGCQFT
jgi:putative FmdB family regulatory protein